MMQDTVFWVTVALMLAVGAAFAYVAANAGRGGVEYPPLQEKSSGLRARFFWTLLAAGALVAVITTLDLPYAATRGGAPEGATVVNIEGRQWAWRMDEAEFRVGQTVVFNVTAGDVNHGLGVYDPDMRMLGQTQVMPGYTNALQITFDRPGRYRLLCMEYCGLAHHGMTAEITVGE